MSWVHSVLPMGPFHIIYFYGYLIITILLFNILTVLNSEMYQVSISFDNISWVVQIFVEIQLCCRLQFENNCKENEEFNNFKIKFDAILKYIVISPLLFIHNDKNRGSLFGNSMVSIHKK